MPINKEIIKSAIVKKHNALTDGHIPKPPKQVLPDRLLNALYWKFENEGETYKITMAELRDLLGLKSSKDDHRIIEAISTLQAPIFLRNFEYKGREIEWMSAPFLSDATKYKDGQNVVEITINPKVVAALKQKYGYTPLEIDICNRFRTKYGLKLYEMFRRYETLPNHEERGVGTVAKSLDELNKMFGTKYKTPSEMKRGIDRGLKEIEKHAGVLVTAFWDRFKKKFVFSWAQEDEYPKLRIPLRRVEELIDWYIEHAKPKIKSLKKYRESLKKKIIEDEFDDLDEYYAGMMKYKYGIERKEIYSFKTGRWSDKKARKRQPALISIEIE
ncbi:replication initiation protein [Hydrogenimonas cancrithermarum]|uniref:Initiator Rep protein WH1 domain-containing protein n=1 Tax=Hydrogenimonas cancrithermarum TaxID=2993563 RepID=A0ABM8FQ03_9BACT|nr:replication initiation protein [Hydrogenimonas cancrithermarum]BDY14030.1 hypothetical protein HCR_23430 [Hydrogenimonas cancrithermarum]